MADIILAAGGGTQAGILGEFSATSGTVAAITNSPYFFGSGIKASPTVVLEEAYAQFNGINNSGRSDVSINFNLADMYIQWMYTVESLPSVSETIFLALNNSGVVKLYLQQRSDGSLELFDSTGASQGVSAELVSANRAYQMRVHVSTGATADYELQINTVSQLSGTCDQTATNIGAIRFGMTNIGDDDVVSYHGNFTAGGSGFPNPGVVTAGYMATTISVNNWIFGTSTDISAIQVPNGNTAYWQGDSGGDLMLVGCEPLASRGIRRGSTILYMKSLHSSADGGSTPNTVLQRIRSGATDYDSGTTNPGLNYNLRQWAASVDPNTGSDWTYEAADAVLIGARINAGSGYDARCSWQALTVAAVLGPSTLASQGCG